MGEGMWWLGMFQIYIIVGGPVKYGDLLRVSQQALKVNPSTDFFSPFTFLSLAVFFVAP